MSLAATLQADRIIPGDVIITRHRRTQRSHRSQRAPKTFRAGADFMPPPGIHEEKQLAESSILQNRRGTRYLMFDDSATIADVFALRCRTSPNAPAYREYKSATKEWQGADWREVAERVARMREGFRREGLDAGDRVAVMLKNSINWIVADQGAFAHGLVTVPLFVDDRPDNVAFILNDAGVKVIVIDGEDHWKRLKPVQEQLVTVKRIVTMKPVVDADEPRLQSLADWLPHVVTTHERANVTGSDLATIVYTSGTTGKPKGVMLSHRNILSNVQSGLAVYDVYPEDIFLSFLPLSHMFERTCDYYLNVVSGASIVFSRSIPQLAEDFRIVQPTIIFSVPRIYERFLAAINDQLKNASAFKRKLFALAVDVGWSRFEHANGRGPWQASFLLWPLLKPLVADKLLARLGGKLRFAIAGGAALSPSVSKVFVGLGLPICQGYGLTEASPLLAVNLLEKNDPGSVGPAVPGVMLKTGENSALLAKGPNIMMGYWNNPDATRAVLSEDGWLNTGDQVRIDEQGFVHITGRLKDIVVMGNGEKIPPVDMELAIQLDPLFEQVVIYGEGRPYLSAIVVLNDEEWSRAAQEAKVDPNLQGDGKEKAEKFLVQRIGKLTKDFPGYAAVRKVTVAREKWTIDNGMMTPTLKLKRNVIFQKYASAIDDMYKGHTL
ncbi:MAG: long-chain fatty acid--CoA ligase [Betaproteobacteria bacterium]